MQSICKDCKNRHTFCHANCILYREWVEEKDREAAWLREHDEALENMWNYGMKEFKKR